MPFGRLHYTCTGTDLSIATKAINAKQKQIATGYDSVAQIFKNSVEHVGNKATNHGRYFV